MAQVKAKTQAETQTKTQRSAVAAPVILLTGFEPFGGESINPSWLIAQALHGEDIAGARVQALCLPTEFGKAIAQLKLALKHRQPQLVLALGQANGRADLTPERVAINVDDARIADNAGAAPMDEPIVARGPAAYFSSLPIKAMVAAMQNAGLPASVSQTAGTFVCNHVFYGLMHAVRRRPGVRAGFMHVPLLPEQAAALGGPVLAPSLPLQDMVQGVRVALNAALLTARTTQADLRVTGGTEN
jgi:pyroglutamyl-peptidase